MEDANRIALLSTRAAILFNSVRYTVGSMTSRCVRYSFAFALLGVLLCVSVVFAQSQDAAPARPAAEMRSPAEQFNPAELTPLFDTPQQEVEGRVEDMFYGIIHYDVYGRAFLVEDIFPLGYRATVEYGYYPRLYETARGFEPRVSRETGAFFRENEQIASYVKLFDEQGNETAYTREGFSAVQPVMRMLAALLGIPLHAE